MRSGHIARAVRTYRQQRRLLEPRGDVHKAVAVHRTRHVGEPLGIAHAPDFFSRLRIVRGSAICADADDFVAIANPNHKRCRIGLIPWLPPRRLPPDLPGARIERRHERFVAAIAADNQQVVVQRRRTAVAVLRFVRKLRLPDNFTRRCQRRRAVGAKMDVHASAVDDGGRRRETIFGIREPGISEAEHFGVHDEVPCFDVKCNSAQRCGAALRDSSRQPHTSARDDRR